MNQKVIVHKQIDSDGNTNFSITSGYNLLCTLGIDDDFTDCLLHDIVLNHSFKGNDENFYNFHIFKQNYDYTIYSVELLQEVTTRNLKGKYSKIEMKKNSVQRIVNEIGRMNAKQIHAKDLHTKHMVPFRKYLKETKGEFAARNLYYKDWNDNYHLLRFKNLFSKHADEISDFERIALVSREGKRLKVTYELDVDIFEYDSYDATLQERKFTREFAKEVYNKKNMFTERELFTALESKDLYVQIIETTAKEHKSVWEQVTLDEMNIKTLNEFRKEYKRQNVPQNKKRKYRSKYQKRRHKRAIDKCDTANQLIEYFEYYN